MSLFRAVSFESMTAASLQWNHDDDDVDFMKEVKCPLAKLPEWLIVAIRLNFLWPSKSSSSVSKRRKLVFTLRSRQDFKPFLLS